MLKFSAELLPQLTRMLGLVLALWGGYYLLTALMSARRAPNYGRHRPCTRFLVLIAARNEEQVIGPLINSLLMQRYPRELYEIWVVANNCTDNTARAARSLGANVLECPFPVRTKGEALNWAWPVLRDRGCDAVCVFDADNLAHPDFLREMNNARCAGAQAAQGFRDSKNPYDTPLSACCSIYYWMMDRFHNAGKAAMGLSAMLNGTGFMITLPALERIGGWNTNTISEDLEMTAQCVSAGIRIAWAPRAVTYDEQPLTWGQSVIQRRRWSSGTLQVAGKFYPRLLAAVFRREGRLSADLCVTLLIPAIQAAGLIQALLTALCAGVSGGQFSLEAFLLPLAAGTMAAAGMATLSAAAVLTAEGRWDWRIVKGLGWYWLFVLTVSTFLVPTATWVEIPHTRVITRMDCAPARGKKRAVPAAE